jgi:hypothetical protein
MSFLALISTFLILSYNLLTTLASPIVDPTNLYSNITGVSPITPLGRCDSNVGQPGAFYWCRDYDFRDCGWYPAYQFCVAFTSKENEIHSLGPDPGGVAGSTTATLVKARISCSKSTGMRYSK